MTRIHAAARAIRRGRWDEMRYVGEAQMVLLRAQAMRWLRPLGKFVQISLDDHRATVVPSTSQAHASQQIAAAIDRASRYGVFRPLCLTRAVALSRMLNSHGIAGHSIRIGVRRDRGSFTARAWVEFGQRVLGDTTASTLAYLPLTQVSVTGNPALSGILRHRLHRGPRHSGDRLTWDQ
ncbi:MAG TPA: lasso peptide biosynthesis B2 protein [Gemmatimonadaceae bacterium]|nr:lasso peptide biosynthesis B2 protein [Gemmatimonadaceae bacterium]